MCDVSLLCHRCGTDLQPGQGQFYVIRIEAFADPTPPTITADDLQRDIKADIDRLVRELSKLSDQEIMDQVYRKLTVYLCNTCYRDWIENPTG